MFLERADSNSGFLLNGLLQFLQDFIEVFIFLAFPFELGSTKMVFAEYFQNRFNMGFKRYVYFFKAMNNVHCTHNVWIDSPLGMFFLLQLEGGQTIFHTQKNDNRHRLDHEV